MRAAALLPGHRVARPVFWAVCWLGQDGSFVHLRSPSRFGSTKDCPAATHPLPSNPVLHPFAAQVFSDLSHVKMNATKSMIGHCLGAAGGMEAIATIQAIRTGWVHPTINHVRGAAASLPCAPA